TLIVITDNGDLIWHVAIGIVRCTSRRAARMNRRITGVTYHAIVDSTVAHLASDDVHQGSYLDCAGRGSLRPSKLGGITTTKEGRAYRFGKSPRTTRRAHGSRGSVEYCTRT